MQGIKQCSKCEITKPLALFYKAKSGKDGYRGECKQCHIFQGIMLRHAPHRKNYDKKYRIENKDRLTAKSNKWRLDNPDKYKEYHHRWTENNKEKSAFYCKKWNEKNPEIRKEYYREYAKNNPEKRKAIKSRKRARRKTVVVEKFTSAEIYERDKWVCGLCKKEVDKGCKYPDFMSPSLDHIVPLSKGGTHERKNVQLAHFICNTKFQAREKGDMVNG